MKKVFGVLFFVLLVLNFISCKKKEETVSAQDLCFDIQRIQLDMAYSALKEFYDPEPFEQIKAEIMEGKLNRLDCIFRIKEILSEYHCVHLSLQPIDSNDLYSKIVPFYFYCYGQDYHVYYTIEKYKKYLGWKLVELGGKSIEEARDIIIKYSPYSFETQAGEKYALEYDLSYLCFKLGGLTQKNGKVKFCFESAEGKIETIYCSPITQSSYTKFYRLAPPKQNEDLPYDARYKNYDIKPSADKRTVYVHYNKCSEDNKYPVNEWIADLVNELKSGAYDTVVFDLRYNPGGNIELKLNHCLYNNKEELEKYNLAIITSGRTYSCSCRFMDDFLRTFPKVKIFGEETGQAVLNYTSVSPNNVLKKLNCIFLYPNQLEETPELYKRAQEVMHSDIHRGTMPDVEVYESFEDFMNGKDMVYDTIYEYFSENVI